jgi:hypothetical protein
LRFGGFILNKIQKTIYDFVADSPVERVIVQLNHKAVFEREFLNNDIDDVSRNHILSVVAREDVDWVVELFQAGDKIMIERLVYDNSFILILEKTMCEHSTGLIVRRRSHDCIVRHLSNGATIDLLLSSVRVACVELKNCVLSNFGT